jgi:hypothetical protein
MNGTSPEEKKLLMENKKEFKNLFEKLLAADSSWNCRLFRPKSSCVYT